MMSVAIQSIRCEELFRRIQERSVFALLDVRQPYERTLIRLLVPAEVLDLFVPMDDLVNQASNLRQTVGELELVVYCHHGVRSMIVAEWLAKHEFPSLANLEGGIDLWSKTIDPKTPRY